MDGHERDGWAREGLVGKRNGWTRWIAQHENDRWAKGTGGYDRGRWACEEWVGMTGTGGHERDGLEGGMGDAVNERWWRTIQ